MKKFLPLLVVGLLILGSIGAVGLQVNKEENETKEKFLSTDYESFSMQDTILVSQAEILPVDNYILVEVEESDSKLLKMGKPMTPIISETYTFPAGTKIVNSDISVSWDTISLSKEIMPTPLPEALTTEPVIYGYEREEKDETVYNSGNLYPSEPYEIKLGSGIQDGEHVLFYNIHCNAQYSPLNNYIKVPESITIDIDYEEPTIPLFAEDTYDFLIITHEKFEDNMQDLADFKEGRGIKTKVVTVDEIYPNYQGVADWEDIKMYLADKVEEWGIDYVLLAGGRKGQTKEWYVPDFPSNNFDEAYTSPGIEYDLTYSSDLYFADVYYYDQYGFPVMDDWDTNDNGIYAEGPIYADFDLPDYYPDVYLGRIPLRYSWEADIIVDKIIEYETSVSDSWFKKAVVIGGDTSPPARDEGGIIQDGIYEGELVCDNTAKHLGTIGFQTTKCYTSENGDVVIRNPEDVIPYISQGCGWVNIQSHSNPALCGNFIPDAQTEAEFANFYTIFDVHKFTNDGKYPFLVVDGCHAGQFNVTFQQIIDAGGISYPRYGMLEWSPTDISSYFLLSGGGGGIGVIGVSALGYGYVNNGITQGLGGWIMPRFAHAFAVQNKETMGEIWVQGINDYINIIGNINDDEIDRKTIEERVLFGDPTVKLGGGDMQSPPELKTKDKNPLDNIIQPALADANAPSWQTGQEWTYEINNIDFSFHEVEGRDVEIHLTAGDFNLEVEDVTQDEYNLAFQIQDIEGTIEIEFDSYTGEDPRAIAFEMPSDTVINGNIYAEKNTIAFTKVMMNLDLKLDTQDLLDQFNINLPALLVRILLPDDIPLNVDLQLDFDNPYELFQFPLSVGSKWALPSVNITMDGSVSSQWLNILNLINNLAKIFGINLIPEALAKYLPVIDISEFLTDQEISNVIQIPKIGKIMRKTPFEIDATKQVTVQAGTFNTYDIEIVQGVGELFYSEEAENFVKISLNIANFIPIANSIDMELKQMSN